jgi:DNA (cytosine-5)-methyltransferase 1
MSAIWVNLISIEPGGRMAKNLLIRNVDDEALDWLESSIPAGVSREKYLKEIIAKAQKESEEAADSKRHATPIQVKFKFIDLFAGIGGFHIGMRLNGGECVFANEWDKYSAQTYRAWTGSDHLNTEDLRNLDYSKEIPNHDVLCGGFPCQPFSIAGVSKKNSLGRKHGFQDVEQGNLFFAICDVVAEKRPAVLLLENVKNLKSHDKGKTWKVIQEAIDALGYELKAQIIDASGWVPQHRERIFMVCFDKKKFTKSEIDSFKFPTAPKKQQSLGLILEESPDKKYMLTDNLWRYLQNYAAKHKAAGNGFGFGLVGPNDISRTLSARYYKDGSEILIKQPYWKNPRRLTPSEAAKLMGFNKKLAKFMGHPNGFPQVCSDMQSYKQFGNAVSPLVVAEVGKEILKVLELRKARLASKSGKSSSDRKEALRSRKS